LTVIQPDISLDDLAGLIVPKKIIREIADKLIKQDPSAPRAVLFAGPPGTGKTTIVKALARQSGFNLVELSDDIKDMYVGESERKLELALNSIEGVSPTILFIDEIDTAFQNRTNASLDGGVSSNYLKSLFKFASRDDLRGKVLIAAATNCPQALDPAKNSGLPENRGLIRKMQHYFPVAVLSMKKEPVPATFLILLITATANSE